MIIIVDGYNVLKMVFAAAQVNDRERDKFILLLGRYANMAHHKIYVVFDGGSDLHPTSYEQHGVTVIYSGFRDSADTVIKDLLDQKQKKEVLLVSTDRELNRYAEQYDIPSMDSIDFYRLVQDRLQHAPERSSQQQSTSTIQKRAGHVSSEELDALMMEGTQKVFRKLVDVAPSEERQQKKSSKIDKQLEKVVKKL